MSYFENIIKGDYTPASTEYAVEVNEREDEGDVLGSFVRQLDVFQTYEEAEHYAETCDEELLENQYLNIIFIDYDENGDEICFGSVV